MGTHGPPQLASGTPFFGNGSFVLDLLSARELAPAVIMLASGTQALQLGGGCTLYLQGVLVPAVTSTNASGFASVRLALPLDPSLRGGSVFAQGFVIDPVGPFAGIAASAGLRLLLAD